MTLFDLCSVFVVGCSFCWCVVAVRSESPFAGAVSGELSDGQSVDGEAQGAGRHVGQSAICGASGWGKSSCDCGSFFFFSLRVACGRYVLLDRLRAAHVHACCFESHAPVCRARRVWGARGARAADGKHVAVGYACVCFVVGNDVGCCSCLQSPSFKPPVLSLRNAVLFSDIYARLLDEPTCVAPSECEGRDLELKFAQIIDANAPADALSHFW